MLDYGGIVCTHFAFVSSFVVSSNEFAKGESGFEESKMNVTRT